MSDLGDLSHCIVESDSGETGRARGLRGRAVTASVLLEAGLVAGMLLWPLLTPAVLPPEHMSAPVPVFRAISRPEPIRPHQPQHPATNRPHSTAPILQQPPIIPRHIAANVDNEPPSYENIGPALPNDLGPGSGDGGGPLTQPAQPDGDTRTSKPRLISQLMDASLIRRVQPEYPLAAKIAHLSGTVQLRAIIGVDGTVRNVQVLTGNPIFVKAAVVAVQQWLYKPTRLGGKPVEVETLITVQFQIQ